MVPPVDDIAPDTGTVVERGHLCRLGGGVGEGARDQHVVLPVVAVHVPKYGVDDGRFEGGLEGGHGAKIAGDVPGDVPNDLQAVVQDVAMPIIPDAKDWTWVLESRCPECGFDARTHSEKQVAEIIRLNARAWPAVLDRRDVRTRPDDSTWSALEYGAHVREVFRVNLDRLALMLEHDDATYANWDQDATAVAERYNEQDPAEVAVQLVDAGEALADAFAAVPDDAWSRRARRSDGARFTVATFALYVAHDPVHHLWDVTGN